MRRTLNQNKAALDLIMKRKKQNKSKEQFDIEEVPEPEDSPSPIRKRNDDDSSKNCDDSLGLSESFKDELGIKSNHDSMHLHPPLLIMNKVETAQFGENNEDNRDDGAINSDNKDLLRDSLSVNDAKDDRYHTFGVFPKVEDSSKKTESIKIGSFLTNSNESISNKSKENTVDQNNAITLTKITPDLDQNLYVMKDESYSKTLKSLKADVLETMPDSEIPGTQKDFNQTIKSKSKKLTHHKSKKSSKSNASSEKSESEGEENEESENEPEEEETEHEAEGEAEQEESESGEDEETESEVTEAEVTESEATETEQTHTEVEESHDDHEESEDESENEHEGEEAKEKVTNFDKTVKMADFGISHEDEEEKIPKNESESIKDIKKDSKETVKENLETSKMQPNLKNKKSKSANQATGGLK